MRIRSPHIADEYFGLGQARRTVGRWRYHKRAGVWSPSSPGITLEGDPPEEWSGGYEFSHGSRSAALQVHFGDTSDPANSALVGVRLSEFPDHWLNMKALGAGASSFETSSRSATWIDAWEDTDLRWEAGRDRVTDTIRIKSRTAPRAFRFAVRVPEGHSFEVSGDRYFVRNPQGTIWFASRPSRAVDAAGNYVPSGLVLGDPITIRGRTYPTFWKGISAASLAERPLPIEVYPTATITGTSDLQDSMLQGFSGRNDWGGGGALVLNLGFTSNSKALFKIANTALPAGGCTDFRVILSVSFLSSAVTFTFGAYQIEEANTWVEGISTGPPPIVGETCWNYREYNTVNWTGSAGCSTSGTDFVADASPPATSWNSTGTGKVYTLDPSWVNAWKGGFTNNGVLIVETSGTGAYTQIESTESSGDPLYVEIDYSTAHYYGRLLQRHFQG